MPYARQLLGWLLLAFSLPLYAQDTDSITFFKIQAKVHQNLHTNPDSSLILIQEQYAIAEQTQSIFLKSYSRSNMGGYFWVTGKLDLALEHFMKACQFAKEINDVNMQAGQYGNMAIIYNDLNDVEKSIEYNLLSLQLGRSFSMKNRLVAYNNLGNIYEKAAQFEVGLLYLDSGLALLDSMENSMLEALLYQNKASILTKTGKAKEAIPLTQKSIAIAKSVDDKKTQVHALLRQAEAHVLLKDDREAEQSLIRALKLCKDLDFFEGYRDAYKLLYEIALRDNDQPAALKYHTNYTAYKDSLFNQKSVRKIAELEKESELAVKEEKLAKNELTIVTLEEEQKNLYIKLIVTIAIALLVIYLLFKFYHYQRARAERKAFALYLATEQKKKVEDELFKSRQNNELLKSDLESKEKELLSFTIDWEREKQLIHEMTETVKQAPGSDGEHTTIHQLKAALSRSKANDVEWDEFKMRFEGVHNGFLKRVLTHAPKLTATDLKLCAFLKMNLNSKQIANLLNIEPSSVDMARYRLRKKLNLDQKNNLTDFINRV